MELVKIICSKIYILLLSEELGEDPDSPPDLKLIEEEKKKRELTKLNRNKDIISEQKSEITKENNKEENEDYKK